MNKYSSIFSQLLSLFPRLEFERLVKQTGTEYAAKGFSSWGHYVAMLFCQLGQAHSLREICNGPAGCFGKLRHLGIEGAAKRSTLAYANEHRSWELFQKVFYGLLSRCRGEFIGKGKFRFKNKLLSFDATVIELCASLFDWAKFRRTKGLLKLTEINRVIRMGETDIEPRIKPASCLRSMALSGGGPFPFGLLFAPKS